MKTLVVYYSRTGVTKKVAEQIAGALGADVEELSDTKKRGGPLGFASAAKDAMLKKCVPIGSVRNNAADYDLVVVGTPVWANTMCSAVRTYLTEHGREIRRAAFFCTTHSSGIEEANQQMQALAGCQTVATAGFRQKHVKKDTYIDELDAFLNAINAQADSE